MNDICSNFKLIFFIQVSLLYYPIKSIVKLNVFLDDLPEYFDLKSFNTIKTKFNGIYAKNKKFFCSICAGSSDISIKNSQWSKNGVSASENTNQIGVNNRNLYKSLHKKIVKHFSSKTHLKEEKILSLSKKETMPNFIANFISNKNDNTGNLISIAYYIALHNRPFTDFGKLIELCESFGVNFGVSLRDRVTCTRMIECIATKMKKDLLVKVLSSIELFSVIVDESDNISNTCCLIIYINTVIDAIPTTFFLTIVPVINRDSYSIKELILQSLYSNGFNEGILNYRFVQFVTDGASVFTGSKTGVGKLLKEKFPRLMVWHCLAHRLELAVTEVRSDFHEISNVQTIFSSVYSFYSRSSMQVAKLSEICKSLSISFKKIGKIFTIRWVASSLNSITALLDSYEAIYLNIKDSNKELAYSMSDLNFVLNLLTMKEALTVIATLSKQLQTKNIGIIESHQLMLNCLKKLRLACQNPNQKLAKIKKDFKFANIKLRIVDGSSAINREKFFKALIDRIRTRSISTIYRKGVNEEEIENRLVEYIGLFKMFRLVDKKNWPENFALDFGNDAIKEAAIFFNLDQLELLADFEMYKLNGNVTELFQNF